MTNNYSVDTTLEVRSNAKSFIAPGIRENVKLESVTLGTTPNKGIEFLSFTFSDEKGDTLVHTEYPVTLRKPLEAMSDEEKKSYAMSLDTQKRRIGQIVTTFVPKEKYSFVANTFKEFAENVIKSLEGRDPDKLVRIKVVLNKKNYTTLPNYWKHTFIEDMNVSRKDSNIKVLTNIDKFVASTPDVESIPNTQDEENIPDIPESPSPNDLPF